MEPIETKDMIALLKEAKKAALSGDETLWVPLNLFFQSLRSSENQYLAKVDFYIASIFEQLILRKSEDEVTRVFQAIRENVLLICDSPNETVEYTIKAYIKAMIGFRKIETAANQLDTILKYRISNFSADNLITQQLRAVLENMEHGIAPAITKTGQSDYTNENYKRFCTLLKELEYEIKRRPSKPKVTVEDLVTCLQSVPNHIDAELFSRFEDCVRRGSRQKLGEYAVQARLRYECKFLDIPHTDTLPLLVEIMTDPQTEEKWATDNRKTFLQHFKHRLNDSNRIAFLMRAQELIEDDADLSSLFLELVDFWSRTNSFPPQPMDLDKLVNVKSVAHIEPIREALTTLLELGAKQKQRNLSWLVQYMLAAVPSDFRKPDKRSFYRLYLEKAISLLKNRREIEPNLLDNLMGLLVDIRMEEITEKQSNLELNHESLFQAWNEMIEACERPWHRYIWSQKRLMKFLINSPKAKAAFSFDRYPGRIYAGSIGPNQFIGVVQLCGAIELSLADANYLMVLGKDKSPESNTERAWHHWYLNLSHVICSCFSSRSAGITELHVTIDRGGKISKINTESFHRTDALNEWARDKEALDQFNNQVMQFARGLDGQKCLLYPDQDLVSRIKIKIIFQAGEGSRSIRPDEFMLPCTLCCERSSEPYLMWRGCLQLCRNCERVFSSLNFHGNGEKWNGKLLALKEKTKENKSRTHIAVQAILELQTGLPFIDIMNTEIDPACLRYLSEAKIRDLGLLPVTIRENCVHTVLSFPNRNLLYCLTLYDLQKLDLPIKYYCCHRPQFLKRLEQLFSGQHNPNVN